MSGADDFRHKWVFALGFVLLILGFVYGLGYTVTGTGTSILNTLARVQAAIFAIVFSVVILGVRLSATRYSPRLASTFRSDSAYRRTVGIFAASIGFDVVLLFGFNAINQPHRTALIMLSAGIAAGAFWTLYGFVNDTLEKTTPEGILTEIEKTLTPKFVVNSAHTAVDDPAERDPFLPLVSVISSTISEKDRVSASRGLDILGDRIVDLLQTTPKEEFEEEAPVDQSLEVVCTNQLPEIVHEAVDEELTQIAVDVTETAETIGDAAVEEEVERVLNHVLEGQTGLIDSLGYESNEERIRTEAIDTSRDLLKHAVGNELWRSSAVGTRLMGWLAAASIMNRGSGDVGNQRYTSLLVLCFPKLVQQVVDSGVELADYKSSTWLRAQAADVEPVDLLISSCYGSMAELTSAAIRYEIQFERSIVRWDSVDFGWTDGFESLLDTDLTSIQQLWLGTVLYLEYLETVTPDSVMDGFDPHAKFHVDTELGVSTVEQIQEGDLDPRIRVDLLPGGQNPVEMPLTGHRVAPVTDPDISFHEWLERQKTVLGMGRFASSAFDGDDDEVREQ